MNAISSYPKYNMFLPILGFIIVTEKEKNTSNHPVHSVSLLLIFLLYNFTELLPLWWDLRDFNFLQSAGLIAAAAIVTTG